MSIGQQLTWGDKTQRLAGTEDGEWALTFPADHPAFEEGQDRSVGGNMHIDVATRRIYLRENGWIEGPFILGKGWVLVYGNPDVPEGAITLDGGRR